MSQWYMRISVADVPPAHVAALYRIFKAAGLDPDSSREPGHRPAVWVGAAGLIDWAGADPEDYADEIAERVWAVTGLPLALRVRPTAITDAGAIRRRARPPMTEGAGGHGKVGRKPAPPLLPGWRRDNGC